MRARRRMPHCHRDDIFLIGRGLFWPCDPPQRRRRKANYHAMLRADGGMVHVLPSVRARRGETASEGPAAVQRQGALATGAPARASVRLRGGEDGNPCVVRRATTRRPLSLRSSDMELMSFSLSRLAPEGRCAIERRRRAPLPLTRERHPRTAKDRVVGSSFNAAPYCALSTFGAGSSNDKGKPVLGQSKAGPAVPPSSCLRPVPSGSSPIIAGRSLASQACRESTAGPWANICAKSRPPSDQRHRNAAEHAECRRASPVCCGFRKF
jgi:hypothetical protein